MTEREVIITGASGGIGGGMGHVFREAGWRTIGIDISEPADAATWDTFSVVDLSDPGAIEAFFGELGARLCDVRCLVNNAAHQVCAPVHATSLDEWDRVMAVNLRAPWLMIRHGIAWLRAADEASVVNITSVHATATSPSIAAYAASKGGLAALTRAAALDLAPEGIRVNAVAPGAVDTPMLRAGLTRQGDADADAVFARFSASQPVGRVGAPAEIGHVVRWLATPETGSFVTGATVTIDGGATIRLSTE